MNFYKVTQQSLNQKGWWHHLTYTSRTARRFKPRARPLLCFAPLFATLLVSRRSITASSKLGGGGGRVYVVQFPLLSYNVIMLTKSFLEWRDRFGWVLLHQSMPSQAFMLPLLSMTRFPLQGHLMLLMSSPASNHPRFVLLLSPPKPPHLYMWPAAVRTARSERAIDDMLALRLLQVWGGGIQNWQLVQLRITEIKLNSTINKSLFYYYAHKRESSKMMKIFQFL